MQKQMKKRIIIEEDVEKDDDDDKFLIEEQQIELQLENGEMQMRFFCVWVLFVYIVVFDFFVISYVDSVVVKIFLQVFCLINELCKIYIGILIKD